MIDDPTAFTAEFEQHILRAIAPHQAYDLDDEVAGRIAESIRGAVHEVVASGVLPLSPDGADRLARVMASVLARQAPGLESLALTPEETARPFAGVAGDDVRVLRHAFVGWVGAQADEEACHLVVEDTMRTMLGGAPGDGATDDDGDEEYDDDADDGDDDDADDDDDESDDEDADDDDAKA